MRIAVCIALVLSAPTARAQAPGPMGGPPLPGGFPPAGARAPAERAPPPSRPPEPAKPAQPSSAAKAPVPRGAVLEEVSGIVREVDRKTHRLTVEAITGPVTLSLDRNSMVYTASGLGTVLDLAPGQQIRAGRNADFLAYWVQVRVPSKPEPAPTPGQGTGPAGGASAPAAETTGKAAAPPVPPVPPATGVPPGPGP
jgi:hypothetical protein